MNKPVSVRDKLVKPFQILLSGAFNEESRKILNLFINQSNITEHDIGGKNGMKVTMRLISIF